MGKFFSALLAILTATLTSWIGPHGKLVRTPTSTSTPSASVQVEIATPAGQPDETAKPEEPEPTPTPPLQVNTTDININDLRYPNSTTTDSGNASLGLQTSDGADTVTNWYKQKFVALGLNSTAIATTKSNDSIINSLSGGNAKATVTVKISQPSASSPTTINVSIGGPGDGVNSQVIQNIVTN